MTLRLLDLFCCAGGAGMGYHLAGFDVVGVDIAPQPNYPFEFHQADAMTYPLDGFDAVHASPPCQDHSSLAFTSKRRDEGGHGTGWMLPETISRLAEWGGSWIVENVPGADMPGAFTLCGRSFGIPKLKRHRQFLTSFPMLVPPCACSPRMQPIGIYGDLSKNDRKVSNSRDGYVRMRAGVATARQLLDCPWMDARELTQAIPPAYTRFIGEQLLTQLGGHLAGATEPTAGGA
jgi:DNA (cytosine-5)-methyltransferase 1